ncbi:hypothetical protein BAC1_00507 [uncultured bacterium]|nr:hypothetical protein BAC1_00507 [uncultured bacterium]
MLAVFFLASIPAFNRFNAVDRTFFESSARRLETFRERAGGGGKSLKVLAIGSSLMDRAVYFDEQMEALAESRGLPNLVFARITRSGGDISNFMPLLSQMAQAAPDIILVESDSVFYDRHTIKNVFLREYIVFLRALLMANLKSGPTLPEPRVYIENEFDLALDGKTSARPGKTLLDKALLDWNEMGLTGRYKIELFLSEAGKTGAKVVLINIPRNPEFLARIQREGANGEKQRLEDDYGIRSIMFDGEHSPELYSDYAHLNEKGRSVFSDWLIEELKGGRL